MKKRILSMLLVLTMLLSLVPTAVFAQGTEPEGSNESNGTIKYVSIGDSMTNGYGFTGYNQDKHTVDRATEHVDPDDYNFFDGTGVYGEGSYANQFAEWLAEEYKADVDHAQLALSAFRPEDLVILLGIEDRHDLTKLPIKDYYFNNTWAYMWNGCEDYANSIPAENLIKYGCAWCYKSGTSCGATGWCAFHLGRVNNLRDWDTTHYVAASGTPYSIFESQFTDVSTYFQESMTDADIISLALGNASFDAYFMDRLFKIWGAMGESFSTWTQMDGSKYVRDGIIPLDVIKAQLCKNDAERAFVDKIYEAMCTIAADALGDSYDTLKMGGEGGVCELMTYVAFSYMYRYKQVIEWIGANNPDAEVMIVGLLNSHHGITMTQNGELMLNMGEGMGAIYDLMNTYVAGVAADYMEKNEDFTGKFLFVEQPENPEMIAKVIGQLAGANWGKIDCGDPTCAACQNTEGENCENGRLDGDIIRYKTVDAFNSIFLAGMINAGVPVAKAVGKLIPSVEQVIANPETFGLPGVPDIATVAAVSGLSEKQVLGTLMFMGAEKAMVTSLESAELDIDALVAFADGSIESALTNAPAPEAGEAVDSVIDKYEVFFGSEEMLPMVRFFALNKVGNGIAAHPTPSNHDRLTENVIAAYENGYTVQDKCEDDPDMIMVNEVYYALAQKGLLTDEQTDAIIDYIVAGMISEDGMDTAAAGDFIYELLLSNEDDADNVEVIATVYPILKAHGYLNGNEDLALVEDLYSVLDEYLNETQEMEVVDYIYANQNNLDTMALVDFMIEVLGKSNMTAEQKVDLIGEVYTILDKAGKLADYSDKLPLAEEIYAVLDPVMDDEQTMEVAEYLYGTMVKGETDMDMLAAVDFIVEVLGKGSMTAEQKVETISGVYAVLKNTEYLAGYPMLGVVAKLYDATAEEIGAELAMDIAKYGYSFIKDGELSDAELENISKYAYEALRDSNLSKKAKNRVIGKIVDVLEAEKYLDDYAAELAVIEDLYDFLSGKGYLNDEQSFAIVDCIYNALTNDGEISDKEIKTIALFIYNTLTGSKVAVPVAAIAGSGSSSSGSGISATDKVAIIKGVYEILDDAGYLADYATELAPIVEIYNDVANASPDAAVTVFETVFYGVLENDVITDEIKNDIIDKVYNAVMNDPAISAEAKMAILEKVTGLLEENAGVELDVITDLRAALKDAGYLTDAEAVQIVDIVYTFIQTKDELTKAQLADEIYTILLNKEGMTVEQKVEVLTIVYTVLDKHGYVDGAIGYAFLVAYNAAKENGYIDAAIIALDIAKAAVELAKAEVEKFDLEEAEEVLADAKALVVEELNNIVATLDKIQGVLATEELTPALYQELLSFEQELDKHCKTAVALARELNEALSPYVFQEVEKVVNEALAAVDFIHEIAADAYEFVTGIPAAYDAWVEEIGAKVDTISPELGALVREYLKANAADAMAIIYAYGDVAIQVLISEAVAAYGDIYDASVNFLRVIVDNAPIMHEAIQNNAEVQALLDQLTENLKKAKAVAEWTIDNPFVAAYIASGIDQETALQAVYAELVRIHNMAYPAVMSALHAIDPYAAEDFCAAYEALTTILCTTYGAADGYLGWVAGHAQAMACELLCALLDNTWEFVVAASPVVDNVMYDWLYTHPYEVIEFCSENAAEIEELIEKYGIVVVGVLGYMVATYGDDVAEFIMENPCEALDMFMDWYNKYGYRIWPMIDVYLEALGVYDAIDEQLETVKAMLSELDAHILAQIAALNAALKDAHDELRAQIEAEIEALYEQLMALLKSNISATYFVTSNSYYVALGDADAYGAAADLLAAELGMSNQYANLTTVNANAAGVLAALDAAEIAKADLITLGFSANAFTAAAVADLLAASGFDGTVSEKNWAALVGEYGAEAVAAALAELTNYVAEQVGDADIAALLTLVVESYAYGYINHLINYVVVSEEIHEINADALLVLVGMHNPMDGVVIDLNGETLDLGEYVEYLVTLTNIFSFGYALYANETIYVDAPDVELAYDGSAMSVEEFLNDLMNLPYGLNEKFIPTEAGYKYIQEQIYNALNPVFVDEDVECEHAFGGEHTIVWTWFETEKGWDCSAYYRCAKCGEKFDLDCSVNAVVTKQPTVEEEGEAVYTASVEIEGQTYTNDKVVTLAKLPVGPDTGDTVMVGLYVTMGLLAAAAGVVVLKKRKNA